MGRGSNKNAADARSVLLGSGGSRLKGSSLKKNSQESNPDYRYNTATDIFQTLGELTHVRDFADDRILDIVKNKWYQEKARGEVNPKLGTPEDIIQAGIREGILVKEAFGNIALQVPNYT